MKLSASHTVKLGLMNLTFSKSGVTVSTGIPGARVSLNSKGQAGVRLGMKGFSYQKKKKIV